MLSQRGRPTLALVGAGRVGRALGRRLHQRSWRIGAVVSRSAKHARGAVLAIGAGHALTRLDASLLAADVVLIATPDRSIGTVAQELARIGGRQWRGKVVLHTSGALDRTVLRPLERLGAATGSLHPMQTFSGRRVPPLEGCVCALEGKPAALRTARRICRDLGCLPVVIARESKPSYHAAGALAAGHILAVIEAATRILMALRFSRRDAIRALMPLTRQTLTNFERLGPAQAWTGPLARGDFGTVSKHMTALRRFPREYGETYSALSHLALLVLGRSRAARHRRKRSLRSK